MQFVPTSLSQFPQASTTLLELLLVSKVNSSRGNPINGSSGFLFFKKHGNLFLYGDSHQRFPVLSKNCSLGDTCEAQLLDSGNLVLVQDRSKGIVWKSFNFPTDTILDCVENTSGTVPGVMEISR